MAAAAGRRRRAADQRREETVTMLGERGVMSPSELAQHFGVSVMTIHRDLNELQRRGIILKSHGGVTPQPAGTFESTLAFRESHMVEAKAAIATAAVELIGAGGSVLLDDSTTAAHLVPHLVERVPVTVATNFLPNMRPLAAVDGVSLIALGGDHDPVSDAFTGLVCLRDIEAVRVDALFVSAAGVDGGTAWHGDPQLVAVKQAMLESAERAYLLVDHSKLGRTALHEIAPLGRFTAVVTDSGAPPDALAELHATGVEVVVADV
ncbi:DeoR/GlpR family DNA-binding transcription regulator [Jatrophihabitans sp. YIM 134969]